MRKPRIKIVSRFSRTHAQRGGGIHKTAVLSALHLERLGWEVAKVSDQASFLTSDDRSDLTWVYTTEEQTASVLQTLPQSNEKIVVVSSWTPNPRGEVNARALADRYKDKFPNLLLSAWTKAGAEAVSEVAGIECVRLTHLQKVVEGPYKWHRRSGVCIGEVAKIQRPGITRFSPVAFVTALRAAGYDSPVYAYAQYGQDLGALTGSVTLVPKLPQEEFFTFLSSLLCFVHLSDGETFGAPPIEAAGCGAIPVLPPMPQSLDEYIDNRFPRYSSEEEAAAIVKRISDDDEFRGFLNGVLVEGLPKLSVDALADQLHRDLTCLL